MLDATDHAIPFHDRADAGRRLAERLQRYANRADVLVLGLPRGGVPVAYEVAKALNARLDVCLVRKLGVPTHEELALGAIASGGVRVLNDDVVNGLEISAQMIDAIAAKELQELQRRDRAYRGDRPQPKIRDRTVILVDDGIATGATMRAAVSVIKPQQPARLIVAAPVAAPPICEELSREVDEVVCVAMPEALRAIGFWYEDFSQTSDEDVRQLLASQL
ncbi:phosphoribosyltransferase [Nodosilinea sp. LEGE 07298]|uniref:phosphoribosyltransferase n=1 Tax=Nodosilinea sp. LEGE 07298 TaxID=2777970 RepID=UPI00187F4374|nr:phosphoribosyltransferase [Nodosilinea sp. LEGE 07298]MBE9109112.1 phosphoribosyltransferase [Nodosilinea sp. LEGE 07298]